MSKRWLDDWGFPGYAVTEDGIIYGHRGIKKASLNNHGHLYVKIEHESGVRRNVQVRKLVALAFVPNPEGKDNIRNIDGNKLNIHASNLEWY